MEAVILKILSMILSVLMFFNNAFSFIFPQEPVENVVGIYGSELFEAVEEDGSVSVISDYVSWHKIADKNSISLEKYNWKFFFRHNVVLVTVELPNPGYTVKVDSVAENGEVLELMYSLIKGEGDFTAEICYEVILVETSKNIKTVSASGKVTENPDIDQPNKDDPVTENGYIVLNESLIGFVASKPLVVSSYRTLSSKIKNIPAELIGYNENYFDTGNLVFVPVTLPGSAYKITVDSLTEKENKLEVKYTVLSDGEIGTDEEISQYIIVETSKNITEAQVTKMFKAPNEVLETFEFEGYNYFICNPNNFDDSLVYNRKSKFLASYKEWQNYCVGTNAFFSKYDEEYFKDNSLGVFYVYVPDESKTILLTDISKGTNSDTLFVDFRVRNGESDYTKGIWAVVVEVDKNTNNIYASEVGFKYGYDVQEIGSFRDGYVKRENGDFKIISNYKTWEKAINTEYYYSEYSSLTEDFFTDCSVALITVMLPNKNYSISNVTMNENGNKLKINYSSKLSEYADDRNTMAEYCIIVAEISKGVTYVTVEDGTSRNNYTTVSTSVFGDLEYAKPVLISDFEAWSGIVTTSVTAIEKYTAEYFENNSVILIPEVYFDYVYDAEVLKIKENGETVDIVYGINGYEDGAYPAIVDYITILVEVSENVKNVSVVRKDRDNTYKQFKNFGPFDISGNTVIISDYTTWTSCVTKENDNIACYDESYFETGSVVITRVQTPNTDGNVYAFYVYENGNTLEMGYQITNDSMLPAMGVKTLLIEVSKNVTQTNIEELR